LGLLIFKFGSRIICVFAKKGEMQNTLYQPLSNAFCVLRSECSQKTHMTSNWKCIWNYVLQQTMNVVLNLR
jgi:hypothetical protein